MFKFIIIKKNNHYEFKSLWDLLLFFLNHKFRNKINIKLNFLDLINLLFSKNGIEAYNKEDKTDFIKIKKIDVPLKLLVYKYNSYGDYFKKGAGFDNYNQYKKQKGVSVCANYMVLSDRSRFLCFYNYEFSGEIVEFVSEFQKCDGDKVNFTSFEISSELIKLINMNFQGLNIPCIDDKF